MRSDAEKFVTRFLDYVYKYDILDDFDVKNQKRVRSPGVQALIEQAEKVFPPRKKGVVAADEMAELTEEQRSEAIEASEDVVDMRAEFAKRTARNGGLRAILRQIMAGDPEGYTRAAEFLGLEDKE